MRVAVVLCFVSAVTLQVEAAPSSPESSLTSVSSISKSIPIAGKSEDPLISSNVQNGIGSLGPALASSPLSNGFSSVSTSLLDKVKDNSVLPIDPAASAEPSISTANEGSSSVLDEKKTEPTFSSGTTSGVSNHEESSSVMDNVKTEPAISTLESSSNVVPPPVVEGGQTGLPSRVTPDTSKYSVASLDFDHKSSSESSKEPEVEAADPSAGVVPSSSIPTKKIPFYVPVEYAAAYQPENFFNPYPMASPFGLGMYGAPPPYRSMGKPWYHLVSPDVPVITLYPEPVKTNGYRTEGYEPCAYHSWRSILSNPYWPSMPLRSYVPNYKKYIPLSSRPSMSYLAPEPLTDEDSTRTGLSLEVDTPKKSLRPVNRQYATEPDKRLAFVTNIRW